MDPETVPYINMYTYMDAPPSKTNAMANEGYKDPLLKMEQNPVLWYYQLVVST